MTPLRQRMIEDMQLRDDTSIIVERLSLDELDDLCFKFKISLEDIKGEMTKDSKARNLIRQFERTQQIPELMSVLRELRKGMSWE